MCVQNFDDSLNSAIRTTYRISLRSSSLREPRYPLLEVVSVVRALLLRRARRLKRSGGALAYPFDARCVKDAGLRISPAIRRC